MSDDTFSDEAKPGASDKHGFGSRHAYGRMHGVYIGLLLALALVIPAAADPRTIEDCEKIQAADAYNQCLASFGPVAHERGVKADPESSSSGKEVKSSAVVERHSSHRSHGHSYRRHASSSTRHADAWSHLRHASGNSHGGGRHRAVFRVKR